MEFGVGRKTKRRKFRYDSSEIKYFIFKLTITLLLLEAYFVGSYIVSKQF